MRSRNIKPSLFKNEILGEGDPLLTILFAGLWCLADKAGRLEDRPKRIKAEIFPYRESLDVNGYLTVLARLGFIQRYCVENQHYIQVANFLKHQSPHKTEKESEIPEPPEKTEQNQESGSTHVEEPLDNGGLTVTKPLIPDSGSLIPDSGSLIPEGCEDATRPAREVPAEPAESPPSPQGGDGFAEHFAEFKTIYPKRGGDHRWKEAEKYIRARLKAGRTWEQILDGARRYAVYVRAAGKEGTEYVKQAATFVGTGEGFMEPWDLPATKADVRLSSNLSAMEQARRELFGEGL